MSHEAAPVLKFSLSITVVSLVEGAVTVAVRFTEAPRQMLVLFIPAVTVAVPGGFIPISNPLSVPIVAGFDPVTLMRYLLPTVVLTGIVADIFPTEDVVPIFTGLIKLPVISLNCAVKVLPPI